MWVCWVNTFCSFKRFFSNIILIMWYIIILMWSCTGFVDSFKAVKNDLILYTYILYIFMIYRWRNKPIPNRGALKNHITNFESVSKSQLYFMMRFTNKIFCCSAVIIVYDPKRSKCLEELDYFTTYYLHYF